MLPTNHTALLALAALAFTGCHNNKEADSADDMHDGSADDDDHRRHGQTQDAEESLQEAEEEMDEVADEVKDEVDGDPATE